MKRFRYLFILLLIMKFTSPSNIFGEEQYKLLDSDLWDGEDDQGNKYNIYKPYPVIFIHGFGQGDPDTWKDVIQYSYLKYYFDPYKDYPLNGTCGYLVHDSKKRFPYLELMDMQDRNGSIDTYDNGAEGWADKLARAIDEVLSSSGAEKVILVCHSMGGLAARELVTNPKYNNYADKVDRIITIDTPHAGSPLARMASNFGNIYRHGWKFPGIGWVLTILVTPVKAFVEETKDIDLYGEAVRDMDPTELEGASDNPGSHFLLNLGEKREVPNPPVYTISGVCSSSFAILLAGGRYFQNEPSDGVVPLQSQGGYPFVRDHDDGHYIMENGRIKTQKRMFPNPEKIDESGFAIPALYQSFEYFGVESQIQASHGGPEGAPFVAAGLIKVNGEVKPFDVKTQICRNIILWYLEYRKPEIFLVDAWWEKGVPYYGSNSIAYKFLFGVRGLYLPASSDIFRYSEQRREWYLDGMKYFNYDGSYFIRPFENQEPVSAGFIVHMGCNDSSDTGGKVALAVVNLAGVRSNSIEYSAIRLPIQRAWTEWKNYEDNTSGLQDGSTSGGKIDKYTCDENGHCEDGSDGILERESKGYMICTIPEKNRNWPIRNAIVVFGGTNVSITVASVGTGSDEENLNFSNDGLPVLTNESGMNYVDITEYIRGATTVTVKIEGQNIPQGMTSTGGWIHGIFVAFEPRDFNPEEQQ